MKTRGNAIAWIGSAEIYRVLSQEPVSARGPRVVKRGVKVGLALLVIGAVAVGTWGRARHRDQRQDLAEALKRAGYEADDAGRVILNPNETGLSLGYDPNLHDPTTGFRACVAQIDSCILTSKPADDCVRKSSRCVSNTPWENDPAGDVCCPESCVREYFELRKSQSDWAALERMVDGTCYPGMKDLATGKWKR